MMVRRHHQRDASASLLRTRRGAGGEVLLLCAALLASLACSGQSSSETPTEPTTITKGGSQFTVTYTADGFVPKRIEIDVNDRVRFLNESSGNIKAASNIHPTHQIYPEFDSNGPIRPGASWTFTFDDAGFWRYHNHIEPRHGGLVVVRGAVSAAPVPLVIEAVDVDFEEPDNVSATDMIEVFRSDTLLEQFVERYGPAATVTLLSEGVSRVAIDCHERAHEAGRMAYNLFGAYAFSLSGHECQAGAFHGATEALFRDRGTSNLQADVTALCESSPNRFFRHQCVHGVGHGLMAWTSYELLDALPMCDELEAEIDRASCYSGLFMENIVGGLSGAMGHYTEYLSDDPHFPCNVLDEKYIAPCYFYQTSRMVELYDADYARVADACAKAPTEAHLDCFLSLGRDVGNVTRGDPARAIELCSHVDDAGNRIACLSGAVQDRFWDTQSADEAIRFCKMLNVQEEKSQCYATVLDRAGDL